MRGSIAGVHLLFVDNAALAPLWSEKLSSCWKALHRTKYSRRYLVIEKEGILRAVEECFEEANIPVHESGQMACMKCPRLGIDSVPGASSGNQLHDQPNSWRKAADDLNSRRVTEIIL